MPVITVAPANVDLKASLFKGSNSTLRETIDPAFTRDNALVLTTQVMYSIRILLYTGDVITKIAFRTGNTAANTPTNWWVALYDTQATPALIAQSADQLTAAMAANTVFDVTLAAPAPYTVVTTGLYSLAIMVKATATPTLPGQGTATSAIPGGILAGMIPRCVTSGSALTTTAPATITSATASSDLMYLVAH